ncbi:hypothetical protein ACWV27_02930 [Massilia varians]
MQIKNGVPSATGVGGTLEVRTDYGWDYTENLPQQIVAAGDSTTIQKMWGAANDCGLAINQQNYSYNAFDSFGGHNSNAAFSTLAACMQLEIFDLGGLAPGLGNVILNQSLIQHIQIENGIRPKPDYTFNPESVPAPDFYDIFTDSDPTPIQITGQPELVY